MLDNVGWQTYDRLRDEVDLGTRRIYMTYNRGDLEMISPIFLHEVTKHLLGSFVQMLTLETELPIVSAGSSTLRRADLNVGIDPDECFYIARAKVVHPLKTLDLPSCPPPDLVIDVDLGHRVLPRLPILAAIGVSEVWSCDGKEIRTLLLHGETYELSPTSAAIPKLRPMDLMRFLALRDELDDTSIRLKLRDWIREYFL